MTKEEAIKLIEHIGIMFVPTDQYGDYDDPQPYEEALDMAIESLQNLSKPNNTCEVDIISRQDAIDAFGLSEKTRKYGGDHSGYDTMMLYEIQDVLESLPSAGTPTYTSTDLIRREDAIDAWWHDEVFFGNQRDDMTKEQWLDYITDVIGSLPSAEPKTDGVLEQVRWERDVALKTLEEHGIGLGEEPRTGKWVKDALGMIVCSECRRWRRDNRTSHVNFCNSCGARMIGEEK